MRRSRIVLFVLPLVVFACGKAEEVDEDGVQAQVAALRGGGEAAVSASGAMSSMSTSGVVDPSKDAAANADAIAAALSAKVCPTGSVMHQAGSTAVTVDFGAGCSVGDVGTVSGAMGLTVTTGGGKVAVALTFTNLAVNGLRLNGTMSVSTADGKAYAMALDVAANAYAVTFSGSGVLDADYKGVTVTGTGAVKHDGVSVPCALAGVHHRFAGCYADAGTATFTETVQPKVGRPFTLTTVLTFLSTTPQTGVVNVTVGEKTTQKTLPAYGQCPAGQ
jgi:hypothetical protein